MKQITMAVIATLFSLGAFATESYNETPEKFIKTIKESHYQEAIDSLYPGSEYWKTPEGQAEKAGFSAKMEKAGEYRFHELLSEKKVGSRYVVLSYLVGFKNRPLFFSIVMYKPEDLWIAKGIQFDEAPQNIKNLSLQ
ncbi:hypothetical protein D3C78_936140 [compost metagenome]